jgi:hypothetical protein
MVLQYLRQNEALYPLMGLRAFLLHLQNRGTGSSQVNDQLLLVDELLTNSVNK